MADRIYLSNIAKAWPVERQEHMLVSVKTEAIYKDSKLSAAKRAARDRKALVHLFGEEGALRPASPRPGETDTLHVASLAVLGWSQLDFQAVMLAAQARQTNIRAHHEDLTIAWDCDGPARLAAGEIFDRSRMRAQRTATGGHEAAAQARRADTARRAALIREDWSRREHTTLELLLRAGPRKGVAMAHQLAVRELGKRSTMQNLYDTQQKRAASRAAKELQDAIA